MKRQSSIITVISLSFFFMFFIGIRPVSADEAYPVPPPYSPVQYDKYSFMLNGERIFIASGEFHYWRLPSPDMWGPVLRRMRANGLNAVSIYFHWGFHSPAPGIYDFSGIRDVERVLVEAEKAGLYVIARPGPYINAETDAGGLPDWLLTSNAVLRTNDPAYMSAVKEWFERIVPIIARHQLHRGGTTIMFQVENELGDGDPAYMSALYEMTRNLGIDVPIFHNDSIAYAQYPESVDFSAHDEYPAWFFCREPWTMAFLSELVDEHEYQYREVHGQNHIPIFESEYQGGSIDFWGGPGYQCCYDKLGPEFTVASLKTLFGEGQTAVNQYMFYGGTSWGYLGAPGVYTSYDYGASLREWTNLGPRYDASKRIMFAATAMQDVFSKTDRRDDITSATNNALLHRTRVNPDTGTAFVFLRNMDESEPAATSLSMSLNGETINFPQNGSITLPPRGMKILPVYYPLPWGQIISSTYEILTYELHANRHTLVLYGERKSSGETVIRPGEGWKLSMASRGINIEKKDADFVLSVRRLTGTRHIMFTKGDEEAIVVFADTEAASAFWRVPSDNGTLLIQGGYFVGAPDTDGTIRIETEGRETLKLYGGKIPETVNINGKAAAITLDNTFGIGSLRLESRIKAPPLPAIDQWRFNAEPFEGAVAYDDSDWSEVTRFKGLSPDEHGFHHGHVWYRGRFIPDGNETRIEIEARHSWTVWINGEFVGSSDSSELTVFDIPRGMIVPGKENVIAILCENLGHNQGGERSKTPVGVVRCQFTGEKQALRPFRFEVDDEMFSFDADWKPREKELFYGGGGKTASRSGARCTVRFEGPLLRIFGATGPDHGQADVYIDGDRAGAIDAYVKWLPGQRPLLFEREGWGDGIHTAEIVLTGQKHQKGTGQRITIDAVEASKLKPAVISTEIDWRLMGAKYGDESYDPVRGAFNASGLYGERHGWHLPEFDVSDWEPAGLPHTFGTGNEWIGWYRTMFDLDLPENINMPLGLVMDGLPAGDDKAVIFLNGWLLGRYWPDKGPQTKFYLHPGILRERGKNTLAIGVWRRDMEGGGLGSVHLEPWKPTVISTVRITD